MEPKSPEGTITVLLTDIEGSSRLWEHFPEGMKAALARHDALLRAAVEAQGGRFVKTTGDGIHAVFETAVSGAAAAAAGQRSLLAETWSGLEGESLRARMALHTGDAEQRDGDYFGPTLNRAARLMALAAGGQILLSELAASLIRDQLPDGLSLLDLGEHRLKDLTEPEHVYQIAADDLPATFPPLPSLNVFPNNLPGQLTSFVGRERELAEVKRLLASTRLLTLIGPGGTGKSRLATQAAADVLPDFAAGVWLVELASLRDPNQIVPSIAAILGLRELRGIPLADSVLEYLRSKQLLLILDNCEHLVEACAELAEHFLRQAPRLKILASSREALGIAGETVLRVPSLALPAEGDQDPAALAQVESVRLFVERAAAVRPGFALTAANASTLAQICRRLDGIPLALELAAARIAIFSPEQIAARLDDRFRLLSGGRRTALPRQQTLAALIDWSYDLLSPEEQSLFRRLSVFSGGWTFEGAEAVCSDLDTLELLTQLVNKSLVIVDDQRAETRYRFLETIRQYAQGKLMDAGEIEQTRQQHLAYFLTQAEAAEPKLHGADMIEWLDRIEAENDNLTAAWEWALDSDPLAALRLAGTTTLKRLAQPTLEHVAALPPPPGETARPYLAAKARAALFASHFATSRGRGYETRMYAEESAALARQVDDKPTLIQALAMCGMGSVMTGEVAGARATVEEAVRIGRETGHRYELGSALGSLAFVLFATQDLAGYKDVLTETYQIARELGNPWMLGMSAMGTARYAAVTGDWQTAAVELEAAEDHFRRMHDNEAANIVRSELGHALRYQGKLAEALAIYRETIRTWQEAGQRAAAAHELEAMAFIARALGKLRRAATLLGAAEALRESIHEPMAPVEQAEYTREVDALRGQMEGEEFAAAWAEGRAKTIDEAVSYALEL